VLDPEVEARRQAFAEGVRDAYDGRSALRRSEQLAGTAEVLLEPERLYLTPEEWAERLASASTHIFGQPPSPDVRRLPDLARAANAVARSAPSCGSASTPATGWRSPPPGRRERRRLAP
jgi:hypothetical protein